MHHPPPHFFDKLRSDSAYVAVRALMIQKRVHTIINTAGNHAQSNNNANYASVTKQSGIFAGEDRLVALI